MSLPDKLSDLLELALNDLEKVEKDEHYIVDMRAYHIPMENLFNNSRRCFVCLAGAVMAKTLNVNYKTDVIPSILEEPEKYYALNELRLGNVMLAFRILGKSQPKGLSKIRYITRYEKDKKGFKTHLRKLVLDLRKVGE